MSEPAPQPALHPGVDRVLPVLAAVLLTVALTAYVPLSYDLGWILEFGRRVVQDGAIPATNGRSFLAPDHPYVLHEWLTCVLLYLSWEALGGFGLVLARWVGVLLPLLAIDFAVRRQGAGVLARTVVLLGSAVALIPGTHLLRAQVVTLAMLPLVVHAGTLGDRRFRWLLVPLFALWANLHGGWLAGLAFLYMLLGLRVLPWARARIGLLEAAALALCCGAATALTPYGPELIVHTVHHVTELPPIQNQEWYPLLRSDPPLYPFEQAFLVLFAVLAVVVPAGLRLSRPDLYALLGITLLAGLSSNRHTRLAAPLLAPVLAVALTRLIPARLDRLAPLLSGGAAVLSALVLAMAGGDLLRMFDYPGPNPGQALKVLRDNDLPRDVWADFNWGGHLLWAVPDARVGCDGRNVTAYPPDALVHCLSLGFTDQDPLSMMADAGVELALLADDHPAAAYLAEHLGTVFCGQGVCLYGRPVEGLVLPEEPTSVWSHYTRAGGP